MAPGVGSMARPKKGVKRTDPQDDRPTVINLKGSVEYVNWLEKISKESRIAKATLFRWAMAELAEKQNWQPPPEI